ncbi:hypothetical protein NYE57_07310 [Bacillus sp. FSL L8-0222]|nr:MULTISPECIES: hypothetical protein [Bacillus mojavensis subgroup]MEC1658591.1 hypothetical protein [Bacillus mojavensis]QPZ44098.1 hypothetical protein I7X10_09880 [Bacillus halotolerans]
MEIMYRGRPFILEDGGDCMRLTSVEKSNGKTIILEFTKDQEESDRAITRFSDQMRKSIIQNFKK